MKRRLAFIVFALATMPAFTASAPDKAKVEAALKAQGFTSWESIVWHKGTWEVDDAIDSKGKHFDLKIDATTLKIISKEEED